jgi:hypothetical protein
LAKFGAAAIFFNADDAASAADGKSKSSQAFDGLWFKALFDIPHDASRLKKAGSSVKAAGRLIGSEAAKRRPICGKVKYSAR